MSRPYSWLFDDPSRCWCRNQADASGIPLSIARKAPMRDIRAVSLLLVLIAICWVGPVQAGSFSFNSMTVSPAQINPGQSVTMSTNLVPGQDAANAIIAFEALQGTAYYNSAVIMKSLTSGHSVSLQGSVTLPAAAALGTYDAHIVVFTANYGSRLYDGWSTVAFNLVAAPAVSPPVIGGVSPSSATATTTAYPTIYGSNFEAGAQVLIGGVAPRGVWQNGRTDLIFQPPLVTTVGAVDVEVINLDGGTATLVNGFTYLASTINGACGAANGTTVSVAPAANFCSAGTASAVLGSGPWTWSCAGSGGGTNAACSAASTASTAGNCTRYVSPSGSLNGHSAYTTIRAGVNALNAGDVLCVATGTYHEAVTVNTAGTSTAPITIQAYDMGNKPTIDGQYTLPTGNPGASGCTKTTVDRLPAPQYACANINNLVMISASNVIWNGINIIHSLGGGIFAGDSSMYPPGFVGRPTCCTVYNIQILKSTIAHLRGTGADIFYLDGAVFSGNDVYDSNNQVAFDRTSATNLSPSMPEWGNGLAVLGKNVTISNNRFHEQFGEPVQLGAFAIANAGQTSADWFTTTAFRSVFNLLMKNNVFYDNWAMAGPYVGNVNGGVIDSNLIYSTGNPIYFRYGSPMNCLSVDSETGISTGPALNNVVFSNNVISNCSNLVVMAQFASNAVYQNVSFYNNTLMPTYGGGPAIRNEMTHLSGLAFFNNLVYSPGGPMTGTFHTIPGLTSGHNIWSSQPSGNILGSTDVVSSNPGLVDGAFKASSSTPSVFDLGAFKLNSGSIAMGNATSLSAVLADVFGTQRPAHPDIGAYQH